MTMFSFDMLSVYSLFTFMGSYCWPSMRDRWLLSISHQLGAKALPKELVKVLDHQIQHTYIYYYAFSALASEASS